MLLTREHLRLHDLDRLVSVSLSNFVEPADLEVMQTNNELGASMVVSKYAILYVSLQLQMGQFVIEDCELCLFLQMLPAIATSPELSRSLVRESKTVEAAVRMDRANG